MYTALEEGLSLLSRLPLLEDELNGAYSLLEKFIDDEQRSKLIDLTFDELEGK